MLLFMESFDHLAGIGVGTKGWEQRGNPAAVLNTAAGRFGGTAWDQNSRRLFRDLPGNYDTIITGFAFQPQTAGHGENGIITLYDSGTLQVFVRYNAGTDSWKVFRGTATQLGSTVVHLLDKGRWHFVECKAVIDNAAGSVEVKVNGTTIVNVTAVDTQNTANAYVNGFGLGDDGDDFTDWFYDDLYILDDVDSGVVGAPNDDFLGDIRVQALLPNGNGTTSDLLGSDSNSTDNYLLVDEAAADGDTTYVESSDVGDKDTYAYANLTATTGTVYGVQINPYARKTDAGVREIASVARLSTTEEDGDSEPLLSSYAYFPSVREANPDGDIWTISDVNSAEFGVKVTA